MAESAVIPNSTPDNPSLEEEAARMDADAAKAAANEPKLAGEEDAPERPEWLPEKFASVEEMAKAYSELEKTLGTKGAQKEATTEKAAEAAVSEAGLNMDALSAEYNTNGQLSQESLDALAKVGITPDMVEAYAAGQEALAAEALEELLEPIGGDQEAYQEMIGWAADNLSERQIDDFNTVLESGNTAAIKMAIQNLSSQYTAANGQEPARSLNGRASDGAAVYESTADLMKDMQNPEYRDNPAFRAKVEAKLARSDIF